MELPATPTPTDSRNMHVTFQSPTADKAQRSLRMQVVAHNFKKRAAYDSPMTSLDGSLSPSLPVATCNFVALSRHFHLPLKVAAEQFGVRATAFKKRCRAIGIRHWPYRKVRSLKRSLQELEQCQQQTQDGSGPPLSDKQLRQFAGYQSQLKRLLSPETYGIDPHGQLLSSHFFHGDTDGSNVLDDHDSDEDSCGSQSPQPVVEHFVQSRNKATKHLYTDSPSSTSAPLSDNLFAGEPMAMNPGSSHHVRAQYNNQFNGGVLSTQSGLVFDTLYDPFCDLTSVTMDPYGENDHPSCGYSLDTISYDFFALQPSPTMAMRRSTTSAQLTAGASSLIPEKTSTVNIAPHGLEGLDDDIFRHISPEYGCLV
uniref:RWP-RK domain-containing protein n=1 Tax=Hyaloperonospora arabidopsidis (strain Emoy2) TaxID=559515 RepID=M4BSC1_HYAAE